ncbi:MAG: hypothetical protein NZL87_07840 [Thermomicrobium sp.]|nr:hypothetical protein [Thermomicrobium sp.]
MFGPQSSGQSVFRGRFVNKPGGFTQIVCQITTPTSSQNRAGAYGAAAGGLEATILTLNSTSVQNGNTWFMPCFRLQASGTAGTNDTDARLVALFGFPVDAVICNQAIAGMPWKAGDNLLDQMGNFRGFAL